MRTGFFFITRTPSPSTQAFAAALARRLPDVILIADAPTDVTVPGAEVVHVADAELEGRRYTGANPLVPRIPSGWDKALFEAHRRGFDQNWFCEDDVLFTGADVAADFVQRWSASPADLLCQAFFSFAERPSWAHWQIGEAAAAFPRETLAAGFMPLARLSRRLIGAVDRFAERNGKLVLFEVMLPSLAAAEGLAVERIDELKRMHFRFRPDLSTAEIIVAADRGAVAFHPIKSDAVRAEVGRAFAEGRMGGTWRVAVSQVRTLPGRYRKARYWRRKDAHDKGATG